MHFSDLSDREADLYRDHVEAHEQLSLIDLAHWMANDQGPVDQMDASLDSLIPLWSWFQRFRSRDLPGVDPALTPSVVAVYGFAARDPARSSPALLNEVLAHYLACVCRRLEPETRWVVDRRSRDAIHLKHTVLSLGGKALINLTVVLDTMSFSWAPGERFASPDSLRRVLLINAGTALKDFPQEPGLSILLPLLQLPQSSPEDPTRRLPVLAGEAVHAPDRVPVSERAGGDYYFTIGDIHSEDDLPPSGFPPLPRQPLADVLNGLGFNVNGSAVTPEILLSNGQVLDHVEHWGYADTVADSELRLLFLHPLESTDAEWETVVTALQQFGETIGARVSN